MDLNLKLKSVFSKFLPLLSGVLRCIAIGVSALLVLLVVFTALSRFGYVVLLGVSVVLTDSMVPILKPGDIVFYFRANYSVGDVIVYCVTPSHCVVHRVVNFFVLDTVNGNMIMVVTKGDNVNATDTPIEVGLVRGRVLFSVPRELWIPLAIAVLIYTFYSLAKTPVIGYSYIVLSAVALASVVAVYATVPRPIELEAVKPPIVNLAGVYFDPLKCYISVRYTGELSLTNAEVKVNSTPVEIMLLDAREIVLKPSPSLVGMAFEYRRPLVITVNASLNTIGRLYGKYVLLVGGMDPEISYVGRAILVRNVNCFPITVNTSIKYQSDRGWLWVNRTYVIEGFSSILIEPPGDTDTPYVYIYWFNQGDPRWIGLPLRRD